MLLKTIAGLLPIVLVAGCAVGQSATPAYQHSGHHPMGGAPGGAMATRSAPDAFDMQMKAMHDMHTRMQAAKTPAERAALMDEHMKVMHAGMAMMGMGHSGGPGMGMGMGMGHSGAAGMGMGMMQPGAQAQQPGMPAAAGGAGRADMMMGMHAQMERRMAMMERMMQMMMDRQGAMPPR